MSKKHKNKGGRPLFDGKNESDVVAKLEQSALIDATVNEMCFYADISPRAYYRYIDKNPKFRQKIEALRERLTLKSKQNIASAIEGGDIQLSKWILERKKSDEFGEKIKLEHSGSIADNESDYAALDEARKRIKDEVRKDAQRKIVSKP